MEIGERIRTARKKAHLNQTELAVKLGITRQLMCKYENGVISNIPSDKIELIAEHCNVSPAYIMGWEDETENGQLNHYVSEETQQIAQEVYENPDLLLVFDACKKLSPEQIKAAAALLQTFKGGE